MFGCVSVVKENDVETLFHHGVSRFKRGYMYGACGGDGQHNGTTKGEWVSKGSCANNHHVG